MGNLTKTIGAPVELSGQQVDGVPHLEYRVTVADHQFIYGRTGVALGLQLAFHYWSQDLASLSLTQRRDRGPFRDRNSASRCVRPAGQLLAPEEATLRESCRRGTNSMAEVGS